MKKVFKLIGLLLFASILSVTAQDGTLKVGPKLNGARYIYDIKLRDNDLSVMTGKGYDLNYWKLSPVSLMPSGEAKPITATKGKAGGMVLDSKEYHYFTKVSLESKEIIFYTKKESKDKTNSLFYQDLDLSFKPITKSSKLATRSTKAAKTGLFNMFSYDGGGYTIKTNRQKDKILIINQAPGKKVDKKTLPGDVTLSIYDPKDMKEIASATYDLGIYSYGASAVVGDDGLVYSLVRVDADRQERKEKKKNGEASWFYKIVGVNVNDSEAQPFEYDLIFKNKGILRASLEITNTGELICAGTYSELTKRGNVDDFDGIFYAKLNPKTGEVIADNHKKLDRSTVEFMTTKRNSKKNEGVSTEFKLRGYEAMDNGTSNLILEEDYIVVVTTTDSRGQTRTTYHYYSKAILVANIASDGEINWIKHIPKYQHTVNDGGAFNSFTYYKDKNDLKFIFADNSKNYDPKTFKLKQENVKNINSMKSSKTAASIALAKMDANGNVEQKLLTTAKKHVLFTRYGKWSKSGNEVYLQATQRMTIGKQLFAIFCFPYGCYLLLKGIKPNYSVARLELD
jgi:hypothetical protein